MTTATKQAQQRRLDAERNELHKSNAELVAALETAIKLLREWHDGANDKVPVRFDLTDHPQVAPLYAILAKASS